jgi:hypothetical protein
MPNLTDVSITFHTHNQGKDPDSVVHVFVKNRLNTTLGSDQNANFVSNLLDSQRYLDTGDLGDHSGGPYLAYRFGLGANQSQGHSKITICNQSLRYAVMNWRARVRSRQIHSVVSLMAFAFWRRSSPSARFRSEARACGPWAAHAWLLSSRYTVSRM